MQLIKCERIDFKEFLKRNKDKIVWIAYTENIQTFYFRSISSSFLAQITGIFENNRN